MSGSKSEPRVTCRTPNKDKPGTTRVPQWKFDLLRGAIRDVLARGPCAFRDLGEQVGGRLTPADLDRLGSLGWHVTSVKLELEVRGEIARVPGSGAQILELKE